MGNNAHGQEHRHETESTDGRAEDGQQSARPFEQEHLKPGISKSMGQQNAQRLRDADKIAEGAGVVGGDEHFVRHKDWKEG